MKIINTKELRMFPSLTGCVLRQASDGGSTLELEFSGAAPSWAQYWLQVTLVHGGKALFTGQVTGVATTNSGGSVRSAVTVQDYWYILERQTSATQIAEIKKQAKNARRFHQSLSHQVDSWASMAESVRLTAPGWTCREDGGAAFGQK